MSTMDPRAAWRRVEAVIDAALDGGLDLSGPIDDRVRREVAELCDGDANLVREAMDLLGRMQEEGDEVEAPLQELLPHLLQGLAETRAAGSDSLGSQRAEGLRIDRYRLTGVLLGRGGMGVVHLAERSDDEFDKQVALKLLPRGLETEEALRRFRTERQILARLEHPGIARLLDGGLTEDGSPYLAMELVEGEPIDRYCDRQDLTVRERLKLFLQVCDAVSYAHRNLVVHRDLKPGNCLVDGEGRVRLLDFGIGKILEEEGTATGTVLQPMTPLYASPEQLSNEPVSTASDVYSLGLLLYRLLTGSTPYDVESRSPEEVRRQVDESPPPTPSSRLSTNVAEGFDRSPELRRRQRELRGDLDVIVLKALRRDPEERYPSVAELEADLRRYLHGHPIRARSVTTWQRVTKFVGRHRAGVLTAALLFTFLVAGAAALIVQGRMAARERDRARVEAARSERVVRFLSGLLRASDADAVGSGERTARELLDDAERGIRDQLASDPVVLASMLEVMATSYLSFGDRERGLALAEEAVALLKELAPDDRIALAEARTTLATVRSSVGRDVGTEDLLRTALADLVAEEGGDSIGVARVHRALARLLLRRGHPVESMEHSRESLRIFEAEGEATEAAIDKTNLALASNALGQQEEVLRLNREALEVFERVYDAGHPSVASTRSNLANALTGLGRYEEAEELYRIAHAAAIEVFGEDGRRVAIHQTNLARTLVLQGEVTEAFEHAQRAAAILEDQVEAEHPARVRARMNVATTELARGNVNRALDLYREGLEYFSRVMGPGGTATERARSLLGIAMVDAGRLDEAEALLRAALSVQRRRFASDSTLALGESLLGVAHLRALQDRCAEARRLLEESVPHLPSGLPAFAPLEVRRRSIEDRCPERGAA